ncbi:MAG: glycosyltransferase [Bacteroidota bacterium]
MAGDLISIALCTYNGIKFLPEQMKSILSQDYSNFEIIIVDDCSTDGSYELLKNYQKNNTNIHLYRNTENLGFNRNFEKALSLCNGIFIAISDQDDIWAKNKLTLLRSYIGNNLLIYHDSNLIIDGVPTTKKISNLHRFVKGNCAQYLLYDNCISGHACFLSKRLLPYVTPFPDQIYYDWWIGYTAANLNSLDFVCETLVQHRRHNASSTNKDKITDKQNRINNLRIFNAHRLNSEYTSRLIAELLKGYEELNSQTFSVSLFRSLMHNSFKLFYTRRKSLYKKMWFILKESTR